MILVKIVTKTLRTTIITNQAILGKQGLRVTDSLKSHLILLFHLRVKYCLYRVAS